jgi:hypothetical protein
VKRWLAIGAIVLGLGAVLYALFARPSDEERIGAKLDHLARVVALESDETNSMMRAARLNEEFSELFTEDVLVIVPELAELRPARRELGHLAARATAGFENAEVSFSGLSIQVDASKTRAQVRAEATLTGSRGGELERDERRVRFGFSKRDGEWLIEMLSVSPKASDDEAE